MAYKIEYTPVYVKKDLTAQKNRIFSALAMLVGFSISALFLYFNRESALQAIDLAEQMVQEGESVADVIAAFCQTLQGGFHG